MPEELEKTGFCLSKLSEENGMRYIGIPFPDMTPLPDIPEELVECVTRMKNEIYHGLRREGIYRHKGAQLVVVTTRHLKTSAYYQRMEIIGPSVASVNEIYSLVRQGELQPDEDWEAPMSTPSQEASVAFSKTRSFLVKLQSFFRK